MFGVLSIVLLSVTVVTGENLASCKNTVCSGTKQCRIIERCWGGGCEVGTTCIAPEDLPAQLSNYQCEFDDPVLRSVDGAPAEELTCGANNINTCPAGTACMEPAGVCCTGQSKMTGVCPAKRRFYFQLTGACTTFCRHDQECPGYQLCCDTGVGCKTCVDPAPQFTCETKMCDLGSHCVMTENNCTSYPCMASPTCIPDKPGTCPAQDKRTLCADQCTADSHCQGDKKCCNAGGCNVCVSPAPSATDSPAAFTLNSGFAGLSGGQSPVNDAFSTDYGTTASPTAQGVGTGGGAFPSDLSNLNNFPASSAGSSPTDQTSTSGQTTPTVTGATNPFSNAMAMIQNMNSGETGGTAPTNPLSAMMDRARSIMSSMGVTTGTSSMSSMMDRVRNMMNTLRQNNPSSVSMGTQTAMNPQTAVNTQTAMNTQTATNPFSSLMNSNTNTNTNGLGSFNNIKPLSSLMTMMKSQSTPVNSWNSLNGMNGNMDPSYGSSSGGTSGLGTQSFNPASISNSMPNFGFGGGGLKPVNPMMSLFGGGSGSSSMSMNSPRQRSQSQSFGGCGMACMMMFMMPT